MSSAPDSSQKNWRQWPHGAAEMATARRTVSPLLRAWGSKQDVLAAQLAGAQGWHPREGAREGRCPG